MNSPCIFRRADGRYSCSTTGVVFSKNAKLPIRCSCGAKAADAVNLVPVAHGPGTELKRIIATAHRFLPWLNLSEQHGCKCNETAAWMDSLGPSGCEQRMGEIVNRLRVEAERRQLRVPFQRIAAEKMVRWAIRRARKRAKTESQTVPT